MAKILVVDDSNEFTALIQTAFEGEFEVDVARDGEEGLKQAFAVKPDLIMLDCMMPKVAGIEMLRSLQAEPDLRRTPVIMMSGSSFDPSTKAMFLQEPNVRAFLAKPVAVKDIRAAVQAALEKKDPA